MTRAKPDPSLVWRLKVGARSINCAARGCTGATLRKPGDERPYECPKHRGTAYEPRARVEHYAPRKRKPGHRPGNFPARGFCANGLHDMTLAENQYWYRPKGKTAEWLQCRPCRTAARRRWELRRRRHGEVIIALCLAKGCRGHTRRMTPGASAAYLCPKHRADPPSWLTREQRIALGASLRGSIPEVYLALQARRRAA